MTENIFSRNMEFWGNEFQDRLKKSAVLIAGAGGLGCVVAESLVRSGIGKLIIIDNDCVNETDLGRQILYAASDIGDKKVHAAAKRLKMISDLTEICALDLRIDDGSEFKSLMKDLDYNGVADCLDNFNSRFVVERHLKKNAFLVHAGIREDFGQVTTIVPGQTVSIQELYQGIPEQESVPVCPQIVLTAGAVMASEILKNINGIPCLMNRLLVIELTDFRFSHITLKKNI